MEQKQFDLDKVLMDMSENNYPSSWTIRDAVEGLQIFGGIGSGKTSGSGRYIALKYLSNDFGGLVLTAKHDEKDLWIDYCKEAGRLHDLIIVEPGSGYHFNFLEYESSIAGSHKSFTLNIVQVLKTVINASRDNAGQKPEDQFWENALEMVLGNTIDLCQLAHGKTTVQMLYDISQSAPKRTVATKNSQPPAPESKNENSTPAPEAAGTNKQAVQDAPPEKITPFKTAHLLAMQKLYKQIENWKKAQPPGWYRGLKDDFEFTKIVTEALPDVRVMGFVNNFFNDTFKNIAEKTRSIIDFNLIGFLYNLLREPTYSLFCRYPSNFTPEDCLQGKIILLNLPVKDYHKMGRDAQIMFKYIWQRAMERRRVSENGRPVFLWADESQNFLHEHDAAYQATARSSLIATVYISQNLPNYFANMGGEASEYKVKSFLGTLGTKIFHANADIETNKYASELVGQAFFKQENFSNTLSGKFSSTEGYHYGLEFIMRPEEFVSLRTGGPANNQLVDGVIHTQGKQITPTANFKKISFSQNFSLKTKTTT